MTENTTTQALLIDRQDDRLAICRYDDDLYVTVTRDKLGGPRTAGPFTADELRAAIDQVVPLPGDPVDHLEALAAMTRSRDALGKSAKLAQQTLEYRTQQRNAAQSRAGRLQRELTAERERSQELLDRARAAEERVTKAPQPRTEEDVTDRELEVLMKLNGTWQEGKRLGQQSALASKRARTIIVALSNLPIQEREEVDAIKAWLTTCTSPTTLARELYARGFTAPGGES